MPNYKLIYFDGKGRAELSRFILAAADVKYEDSRIDYSDWPAHKTKFRFQQVPVLEVDGAQLHQSIAISHFLARELNLAGKTTLQEAHCLAIAEQIKDLLDATVLLKFRETNESVRAEKQKEFENGALKTTLTALEAHFKEHMSASGYIVGNNLTWADLAVYSGLELVNDYLGGKEDHVAPYPTLVAHRNVIGNLPRIKKYLEGRPKTDF